MFFWQELVAEYDRYVLAKNYFDMKEYDRAAFFIQSCSQPQVYFLHMYARYLSSEKKRLDDATDDGGRSYGNAFTKLICLWFILFRKRMKEEGC